MEIKEGLQFRSQHFKGLVTVLAFSEADNTLHVRIDPEEEGRPAWEEDHWNLQHTKWGFEKGEYYLGEEIDHGGGFYTYKKSTSANEIKYRTWFPFSRTMTEPFSLMDLTVPNGISYLVERNGDLVVDGILMVALGQRDMKGKEIFAGDILQWNIKGKTYMAVAVAYSIKVNINQHQFWYQQASIVGNYYQNEELINQINL